MSTRAESPRGRFSLPEMDNPLKQAQKYLINSCESVAKNVQRFSERAEALCRTKCGEIGSRQPFGAFGPATRTALAALSTSPGFQPLMSVAMARDHLKAQLATVPVYAVANKKDEYVLLTPQKSGGAPKSRIGLLFMSQQGATDLVEKLKKENPKLGKAAKVVVVGLDDVYDLITYPSQIFGIEGVTFRLVPDTHEVASALEVFRSAGVPARSITGVPVFQAEGLSVTAGENERATPLFLSKSDLDIALKTAGRNQNIRTEEQLKEQVASCERSVQAAQMKVEKTNDSKDVKKWKKVAEKAQVKMDDTKQQLRKIMEANPSSRVEVGSLEDVMDKMGKDKKGAWSNVVFVRQGIIQNLRDEQLKRSK